MVGIAGPQPLHQAVAAPGVAAAHRIGLRHGDQHLAHAFDDAALFGVDQADQPRGHLVHLRLADGA